MLLMMILPGSLFAQIIQYSGLVLNAKNLEPVPYATVGLKNRNVGTNSDHSGQFSFRFDSNECADTDSWVISSIGYSSLELKHPEFLHQNGDTLYLEPTTTLLHEVVINRNSLKSMSLGKKSHGALTHMNIYSVRDSLDDGLSQEFGVKLKLRRSCLIEDYNVFFSSNSFDELMLQFLIYAIEGDSVTNLPLHTPVIFSAKGYGWASVELREYEIELSKGLYAFVARIVSKKSTSSHPALSIPMTTPSPFNGYISRQKSEDTWHIRDGANPSIYLNVLCEE
jgi:hypothetical protein